MLQTIWHYFSVQFLLLFQMVYSVLLSVLHFKTILVVDPDWLLEVFYQSAVGVLEGNTASKMEHNIWESNENGAYTWCQIVCSILFNLFLCMTSSVLLVFESVLWLNHRSYKNVRNMTLRQRIRLQNIKKSACYVKKCVIQL